MTYDLNINQELYNLKNDYESLMKQKNDLEQKNQDIKNSLSEQQTKTNVHTQRQGPAKEVYQQPGHVLRSIDKQSQNHSMRGKGGDYGFGDTDLRNQYLETGQTFPIRKRLRPNNDEQSETTSSVDSMEIDEHHKDFFSESDSEESDMVFVRKFPTSWEVLRKHLIIFLRCVKDILKH